MGKSVLVVDDDKMLRDALSVGLVNAGFDVLRAESAEMATEIISRITPDAIILDRMLGGMDGLTFLKKFRKNNKITPVIMLTALSGAQNTIDGLTDGADDYMAKPFQLQELILRLNNLLKKRVQTNEITKMPDGLIFAEDEFFVKTDENQPEKLLSLSNEEKKLLQNLTNPVGNIVSATPMVAKRLRIKINSVLSNLDIITVRGMGYKIITTKR